MKKITITIGLVAAMLSTKAQDTTCTMFYKKEVLDDVKKPTVVMKKTDDGWEMSIGEVDKK